MFLNTGRNPLHLKWAFCENHPSFQAFYRLLMLSLTVLFIVLNKWSCFSSPVFHSATVKTFALSCWLPTPPSPPLPHWKEIAEPVVCSGQWSQTAKLTRAGLGSPWTDWPIRFPLRPWQGSSYSSGTRKPCFFFFPPFFLKYQQNGLWGCFLIESISRFPINKTTIWQKRSLVPANIFRCEDT